MHKIEDGKFMVADGSDVPEYEGYWELPICTECGSFVHITMLHQHIGWHESH